MNDYSRGFEYQREVKVNLWKQNTGSDDTVFAVDTATLAGCFESRYSGMSPVLDPIGVENETEPVMADTSKTLSETRRHLRGGKLPFKEVS